MKIPFLPKSLVPALCTLAALGASPTKAAEKIVESAREIPVAYDVDVVVIGGTLGGVSAAVAAAEQGASVFLAAPRPYLGEDAAGTLRLWLEEGENPQNPLERAIFDRNLDPSAFQNKLEFTYETDVKASSKHPDGKNTVLRDGRWDDPANASAQYDADVTITADLGKMARVKELHLLAYKRAGDFEVGDVQVWTSPNGTLWRDLGVIEEVSTSGSGDQIVQMDLPVKQPSRYVKLLVKRPQGIERSLLGELVIIEDGVEITEPTKVRVPPTPMQVKIALDEALIGAGVKFLYGSATTDILQDADGRPAGIVIANRAGRQAVKAKTIIDATDRSIVARMAGATFAPYPAGKQKFQRVVVGGEVAEGAGISGSKTGARYFGKASSEEIISYELELPMDDGTFASFSAAENLARNLTFDVAFGDEADTIFQVPPDPMKARANVAGDSFDPETIEPGALQPEGIDGIYILGGCAGVSREAAAKMLRPLAQMRLGRRIGAEAAGISKDTPALEGVTVRTQDAAGAENPGEVMEFLQGTRPTHEGRPTIPSPERSLPVLGEYDVVVVGGGTGGAPAGIGAARKGAKTLVIEYQDHLGGVGTLGLISSYYHGYRKGFTSEVDKGVGAMGGPSRRGGWNPVAKREWWRNEILKAGGEIWFSTLGCGAVVRDQNVVGVVVATPHGRGVVLAKSVVDSTGNTDIAVAAGAKFITTSGEHVAMQGTGLSPKALGAGYTNTDYSFADESDPVDQWRMIVSARRKYRNNYDLSTFIDTRERRRIVGEVFVSPLDIINDRTYHDTISLHESNFDTHGYTVHPIFLINFPDKKDMIARVPYRALLPKGLDGILVTGLGMSAHRDSMPILRMQACIQNQGYAAGVAAATAADEDKPVRSIDIRALQEHLAEIGSIPASEIGATDSEPHAADIVEQAVQTVVKDYRGLAVLLEQKEQAIPLLKKAHDTADGPEAKLVYANILGMLGSPEAAATLAAEIRDEDWDVGWNFRGMGQFGGSISRLDSYIIALGRSSNAEVALPIILEKLATLDKTKEFSHHRAVALALEELKDPRAAKPLADLLNKEGMSGHHIAEVDETTSSQQEQRSEPLREIILARALFRCGDHEGVAEQILKNYEKDLRGLFAKHAHAVLNDENVPVLEGAVD